MTYPQAIQYLESFANLERFVDWRYKQSLQLERFKAFLARIGDPLAHLRSIHVAGSKGKGSTCAFIAYILKEAGYKVGLYTSPHLCDFRERIRVLDDGRLPFAGMIPKRKLAGLVERLKPDIEKYNKLSKFGPLTFFEIYTAMAFTYFKEKKVDFAVLETGLGGRLDATNAQNSLVSVITPISYEHTHLLGKTLREIAREKAAIIKGSGSVAVTAPQGPEAMAVIKKRCRDTGSKLRTVDKTARLSRSQGLRIRLIGEHQKINAQTACLAIKALGDLGINIKESAIRLGLYNTVWPGRCEVVARKPLIILDGAQNGASSHALRIAINDNFRYKRLILILGISSDKDIGAICKELCPLADEVILTQAASPRAASAGKIENIISRQPGKGALAVTKTESVKCALTLARLKSGHGDLILVSGSLFVVGEARAFLKH